MKYNVDDGKWVDLENPYTLFENECYCMVLIVPSARIVIQRPTIQPYSPAAERTALTN